MRATANPMPTRYCDNVLAQTQKPSHVPGARRSDGIPIFDAACPGAEESAHRVAGVLLAALGDRELCRPNDGALVPAAVADPELADEVGDRQVSGDHLVSIQALHGVDFGQPLLPPPTVIRLQ